MFFLGGINFPTSGEELIAALMSGLKQAIRFPGAGPAVHATGNFPALDSLRVDLTGGQVDPTKPPPKPEGTGKTQPGVTVADLRVTATPLLVAAAPVTLDMTATQARLDFDRDTNGAPLLVASHLAGGNLSLAIPKAALETLVFTQAKAMAAQQGANITQLSLVLTSRGPRSVSVEVRVSVKKFFVSGIIRLSGQLDITDALVARISNLDVKGEGLAMSIAEGFLRGKLKQAEGKEVALASFAAGGLRLRDVRIDTTDPVRVTALFGG